MFPWARASTSVVMICLLFLAAGPLGPAPAAPGSGQADDRSPAAARFLAIPRTGEGTWEGVASSADLGVRTVRRFPQFGVVALEVEPVVETTAAGLDSRDPGTLLQRLRESGRFEWVAPAGSRRFSYLPDDEYWDRQWGLPAVGMPVVWDTVTGSSAVTVAVVDTGLKMDIADFAQRVVHPYSALTGGSSSQALTDFVGHGTGAAAVAAASGDDGFGIAGAAWGVGLMPVKVSDDSLLDLDIELAGLVWAVEHGASVLNLSFGSVEQDIAEELAVRWALDRGSVVVAAAGNGGMEYGVEYPAAYPGVVAVGSVRRDGVWSAFSAGGPELDLVAPGEDIFTWTLRAGHWEMAERKGTSFASPLVAGVAALMLSVNPDLGPADVEYILTRTADDRGSSGWDHLYGWGVLDAAEAVEWASSWDPQAFIDVPAYHPYALAVVPLASAGVVGGFGDGTFGPEKAVTRQQFAKMVVLALGLTPTEEMISPFVDVARSPTGLYPDHYVALAAQLGITTGTSIDPPLFDPYGSITRAQVVTMAVRAVEGALPGGLRRAPTTYRTPFGSFSPVHDEAAKSAHWNGMMDGLQGMGPGYDMWAPATRGEVASLLAWVLERRTGLR